MRRGALALLLALLLALAACAKPPEDPPVPPAPPAEEEPLSLAALAVEFAVDGRDADTLLALQKAFPAALTDALAAREVTVETVTVTFGTSGEATEIAVESGAVQLAFLNAADYLAYRSGDVVALAGGGDAERPDLLLAGASVDPRLAEALRDALPDLAPTLAGYAPAVGGVYVWDEAAAAALVEP